MSSLDQVLAFFKQHSGVEAVVLGGSRAAGNNDPSSDYDIYVYTESGIDREERRAFLVPLSSNIEIGNSWWEEGDEGVLLDQTAVDIMYRNLDGFTHELESVIVNHQQHTGYTTCMWFNLMHTEILYDRDGRYATLQKRFAIPYPEELRENIIRSNRMLLSGRIPSYPNQIAKAIKRGDPNSINHRTTAFLASYFDVVFAMNRMLHPGEKRLVSLCEKGCSVLPADFASDFTTLFALMAHAMTDKADTSYVEHLEMMVRKLDVALAR